MTTDGVEGKVAQGFFAALLGRMGALIEAVSIVVFAWLYGAEGFGLFAVLWGYMKVMTAITEWAQPIVLQRLVPGETPDAQARALRAALTVSLVLAVSLALVTALNADRLGALISAAPDDMPHLRHILRIYVWVLPLWTFVEVGTSAIRALGTFGPEIKVRIFYEQGLRLALAVGFAGMGLTSAGLFYAHLISVGLAALLTLRLIVKHYRWRQVFALNASGVAQHVKLGGALVPVNLVRKLFSELPVFMLNALIAGAGGAAAAGLYAVARKLASVLQVVRLAFDYVMAPLSAAGRRAHDDDAVLTMAQFSTRLAAALALSLGCALILAAEDILALLSPAFAAAYFATLILLGGRMTEAMTGPAAALNEALSHPLVPTLNGLAGIAVTASLSFWLIPSDGPFGGLNGAAIAAALGLNMTAYLAFLQAYRLNIPLWTWDLVRIAALALAVFAVAVGGSNWAHAGSMGAGIATAILALAAGLWLQLNYGIRASDAAALGKLGAFRRRA